MGLHIFNAETKIRQSNWNALTRHFCYSATYLPFDVVFLPCVCSIESISSPASVRTQNTVQPPAYSHWFHSASQSGVILCQGWREEAGHFAQ